MTVAHCLKDDHIHHSGQPLFPAGAASGQDYSVQGLEDDFMLYKFKVEPCMVPQAHGWKVCPYVHSGEPVKRRHPSLHYGDMCPAVKKGLHCQDGPDSCCWAHNAFELWLHPSRFKTTMCRKGAACSRGICFFAHTPGELQAPGPRASPELKSAAAGKLAALASTSSGVTGATGVTGVTSVTPVTGVTSKAGTNSPSNGTNSRASNGSISSSCKSFNVAAAALPEGLKALCAISGTAGRPGSAVDTPGIAPRCAVSPQAAPAVPSGSVAVQPLALRQYELPRSGDSSSSGSGSRSFNHHSSTEHNGSSSRSSSSGCNSRGTSAVQPGLLPAAAPVSPLTPLQQQQLFALDQYEQQQQLTLQLSHLAQISQQRLQERMLLQQLVQQQQIQQDQQAAAQALQGTSSMQ